MLNFALLKVAFQLFTVFACCFQTVLLAVPGKIPAPEASAPPPKLSQRTYSHSIFLDDNSTVLFKWRVGNSSEFLPSSNGTNDVLVAELSIPTHGYVALGWSPNGGMPGANMLVMWVDSDTGRAHIEDRYAVDFIEPLKISDSVGDSSTLPVSVLTFDGQQNASHTTVRFVRWLDANCKNAHDISITQSAMHVIYAFSDQDPDVNGHMAYHGPINRGTQTLYLLDDVSGEFERDRAAAVRDGKPVTYTADNFRVPAVDTTYQCTYFQFPEITKDVQIVGFEPVVQPNNTDLVHHFSVHLCDYDAFSTDSPPKVPQFACYDTPPQNLDANYTKCFGIDLWGWGVGGTGSYFPRAIGLRLTPRDSKRFFIMEIHYNNPALSAQRTDNSGFRMLLTDDVMRKQEASLVMIAASIDESVVIPGNTPSYTIPTLCHDHCTKTYMPPNGSTIFSVFLHSHLLGKSLTLRHFRNGVELPAVLSDPTYDFNYQQHRPANATVLPGDRLVMECNYSSTDRTPRRTTTTGGLSTRMEMCTGLMFFSPPIDLKGCANKVDGPALSAILNLTDVAQHRKRNVSWEDVQEHRHKLAKQLSSISWSMPESLPLVKRLQDFYLTSNQTYVCMLKNGSYDVGRDTILSGGGWIPYKEPELFCTLNGNTTNILRLDGLHH